MKPVILSEKARDVLCRGGVFVPSPLALDSEKKVSEKYQRLLTLYYIQAGARAVIPAAHTGEFAGGKLDLLRKWLSWIKEMTVQYGRGDMLLMAAAGGKEALKQVEAAAEEEYDLVMLAPTAFTGKSEDGVIRLFEDAASILPVFGFELQRAIPGSYPFTKHLWTKIFAIAYGAKGASFDTYRSITMLEAAAESARRDALSMLTGNDDRIVADLSGIFPFMVRGEKRIMKYAGGLLGHFATDTHAAVRMVTEITTRRDREIADTGPSERELAHAVNRCNMALFDATGNFENSVWGVKYRLTRAGLLPGPYCLNENGRDGQAESIDYIYSLYPSLCDDHFLAENLNSLKKEVGLPI